MPKFIKRRGVLFFLFTLFLFLLPTFIPDTKAALDACGGKGVLIKKITIETNVIDPQKQFYNLGSFKFYVETENPNNSPDLQTLYQLETWTNPVIENYCISGYWQEGGKVVADSSNRVKIRLFTGFTSDFQFKEGLARFNTDDIGGDLSLTNVADLRGVTTANGIELIKPLGSVIDQLTYKWTPGKIQSQPTLGVYPKEILAQGPDQPVTVTIDLGIRKSNTYNFQTRDVTANTIPGASSYQPEYSGFIDCKTPQIRSNPQCSFRLLKGVVNAKITHDPSTLITIASFQIPSAQKLANQTARTFQVGIQSFEKNEAYDTFNVKPKLDIVSDVVPILTPSSLDTKQTPNQTINVTLQKGTSEAFIICPQFKFDETGTVGKCLYLTNGTNPNGINIKLTNEGLPPNSEGYTVFVKEPGGTPRGEAKLIITGTIDTPPPDGDDNNGGEGNNGGNGGNNQLKGCTQDDIDKGICTSSGGITCDPKNPDPDPATGRPRNPGKGVWTAIGCVPTEPTELIKGLMRFSSAIGGGIALLLMIAGAFRMLTSQGNPDALKGANDQFTNAAIGLLFIIFSVLLLQIIGVDILQIPGFTK